MKRIFNYLLLSFFVTVLWDCQNKDLNPSEDLVATKGARTSTTTPTKACETITFEGIKHGTRISNVSTASGVVDVYGFNPNFADKNAATIFDSNVNSKEDPDLKTPGKGTGNTTKLNNLLIVQENLNSTIPDDAALKNTRLELDFTSIGKVDIYSLHLIDVEGEEVGATVMFYDATGKQVGSTVKLPSTGDNGVKLISFTGAIGVTKMVVTLNGSGAIDNIGFCRTKPNPKQCTYTQGYWKNHPQAWPVKFLYLGNVKYTKAQLLELFKTPVKGNGLVSLAHQLIAAKLNVANSADDKAIASCIAEADKLIGKLCIPQDKLSTSATSKLVDKLTQYNEGKIGPGHCK